MRTHPDRRVISIEDAARKIRVAAQARNSKDFLIVARTDARSSLGLDEALRRGEALAKAGADILFIESTESIDELLRIGETFDLPLLAIKNAQMGCPLLRAKWTTSARCAALWTSATAAFTQV